MSFQSVMERPARVRRVTPPMATSTATQAAHAPSQTTTRRLCVSVMPEFSGHRCLCTHLPSFVPPRTRSTCQLVRTQRGRSAQAVSASRSPVVPNSLRLWQVAVRWAGNAAGAPMTACPSSSHLAHPPLHPSCALPQPLQAKGHGATCMHASSALCWDAKACQA